MWIILIVLAVLILYLIGFFNSLKTLQVRITASIQEIGNQLKRQSNLIPNLVESVKGFMKHEKGIFAELAEANPQIQSSTIVSSLMEELRDTADKVMYARRLLIDLSADFNIKISTIP